MSLVFFIAITWLFSICTAQTDGYWTQWYGGQGSVGGIERVGTPTNGAYITKICTRHGWEIDAVAGYLSDGTFSGVYGDTSGGSYGCTDTVNDGECFTYINLFYSSFRIYALQFGTSDGLENGYFGKELGTEIKGITYNNNTCLTKIGLDFIDIGPDGDDPERLRLYRVRFHFGETLPPTPDPTPSPVEPCPPAHGYDGQGNGNADPPGLAKKYTAHNEVGNQIVDTDGFKGVNVMTIVWVSVISVIVSLMVVLAAYSLCIKQGTRRQVYDKVVEDEDSI